MEELRKQLDYAFASLLRVTEHHENVGSFKLSNALGEVTINGIEHQIQLTVVPKDFHWIKEDGFLMSFED